jgi:TonB-linked SusC/RagA family outer membrane protein
MYKILPILWKGQDRLCDFIPRGFPGLGLWQYQHLKCLLMLKLSIALVFFTLSVSASTYSQTVSIRSNNISPKALFEAIKKQTGYAFILDQESLKKIPSMALDEKETPLEEFLERVLKPHALDYTIKHKTIIVKSALRSNDPVVYQNRQIRGTVKDNEGNPLENVNIRIIGKRNLQLKTNAEGSFTFTFEVGDEQMSITSLGYTPQIIDLVPNKNLYDIVLLEEIAKLDDVVVTGYTERTREQFTGAATVITRKDLEKFNNNNIFAIIQSIDPAFRLDENIQAGSNPNVIPQINIRGISSVGEYSVNAPLVILDGFEVPLSRLYDMDVNRIENISILKDASATSLYGSRGGNGVIVIETRMPKDGKFTVTYDARPSITLVDLSDYNLMNASEKLEYERLAGIYQVDVSSDQNWSHFEQEAYDYLYSKRQRDVLAGVDSYWLKQPVRSVASVGHSVRIEGGKDEVRYSLDGNYNDFKGVMKDSGRKLVGGAFNLIYRIPNKFTFRNIASYQHTTEYNSPYGSFSAYTRLNPYERMQDANGNPIIRFSELGDQYLYLTFGPDLFNPIYNAGLPHRNQSLTNTLTNNTFIEWFATDQFRVSLRGVVTKGFTEIDQFMSPYHTQFYTIQDVTRKGSYSLNSGESLQFDGNINFQFSNAIGKHQIIGNLIGEVRSNTIQSTAHLLTGFSDDRIISPSIALQYAENSLPSVTSNPVNSAGVVLSGLYSFDNRYNISANLRWDASSIYGRNNRSNVFWNTGVRYNLHREEWFANPVLNFFSLYANVGVSGLENFRGDMALSTYQFSSNSAYFRQNAAIYSTQGNPSIGWPKIEQRSAGLEVAFFQNLVKIDASYYNNITNDMITSISVAPSLGFFGNRYTENLGKVSNKGFEISSEFQLIQRMASDFTWVAHLGIVQNRGKLLEISNELRQLNESMINRDENGNIIKPSTYYEEGQSLQVIRAVPSLGIDPATGRELFRDRNGNITYTWNANDLQVVGNQEPQLFGNFGTSFGYKGLGATVLFRYSLGGDLYNQTLMDKIENNNPFYNADRRVLEQRWKQPGDQALFKAIDDLTTSQVTSRFVQRENFLALSSVNVFYEISSSLIARYKLQRLRLNFSSNDIFRGSTVRMERGIDYPYARTYNFGLMIQF